MFSWCETENRLRVGVDNWDLLRYRSRASSVFRFSRLQRFLLERLPVRTFEELPTRLVIVTTDLATGKPYLWDSGDLVKAILAGCSVPGLLPPVRGPHGRLRIDGALSDNVPVEIGFRRGADRVIGILCRTCATCRPHDTTLAGMLGQAFGIAVDCKWRSDTKRYAGRDDVLIIEPDIGLQIASLDFSHGKKLCQAGYRLSRPALERWLQRNDRRALEAAGA